MSTCIRSGNRYKRHKYKNGVCVKCKAVQTQQLADLRKRREERKARDRRAFAPREAII